MFENIIKACQDCNTAFEHNSDGSITDTEADRIEYFNIDLAKSIIQDLDARNVTNVAQIILGYTGTPTWKYY